MKIEIKPIKIKENEWLPHENNYFHQDLINEIIETEKLTENMNCIINVDFNSDNQTFTNVVFDCSKYNGEFIYLIKTKNIIKDRNYFFSYVTGKSWNTNQKIILSLTIDVITSNYDLFEKNKFKGQAYKERTNNEIREINNYHPDICSNISNLKRELIETNKNINTDIDIFVDQKTRTLNDRKMYTDDNEAPFFLYFETTTYGTAFTNSTSGSFIAYNSTIPLTDKTIKNEDNNTINTITDLLKLYSQPNTKFSDKDWHFRNKQQRQLFIDAVSRYGHENTQLNDITILGNDDQNINSWISVPKFFDNIDNNIISHIELELDDLPNYNLKNHTNLHNNYFLIIGKTFKIPLDLIKIKNKKIYVSRIVSQQNILFKFYYEIDRIDSFYSVNMSTANGLNSDKWKEYQRDLDISYNSGQKGLLPNLQGTGSNLLYLLLGSLINSSSGFKNIGKSVSGILGTSVLSSGFSAISNLKQQKYNEQQILSKGNETKNILLYEALNDILFYDTRIRPYGNIHIRDDVKEWNSYFLISNTEIDYQGSNTIKILVEKPLETEIDKINQDQEMQGNIVNQLFLKEDNILKFNEHTKTHLYFKGQILPDENPVDNFQLNVINDILDKGIFIYKKRAKDR